MWAYLKRQLKKVASFIFNSLLTRVPKAPSLLRVSFGDGCASGVLQWLFPNPRPSRTGFLERLPYNLLNVNVSLCIVD